MKTETRRSYDNRMLDVLLYIQEHLDDDLALPTLAHVAAFSPFHYHRIFRGMVGETVAEYVRRLRLERAARQLRDTDRPVIELALDAGYEAHEAFTRAFRARFGEPPSGFRKSSRDRRSGGDSEPGESGHPRLAPGGSMPDVQLETLDPSRVAFLRHVGPYSECAHAWDRLLTWAGAEGLAGAGTRFIGLCYDDPRVTSAEHCRYDACVTVDAGVDPPEGIALRELPGGLHVRTTHQGPYDRLGETYDALFGVWLPASGREPQARPCLEEYLNSPESTEPEELLTDVWIPLEDR